MEGTRPAARAVLPLVMLIAAACTSSQSSPGSRAITTIVPFDPRDFPQPTKITNRWLPLVPGTRYVLQGQVRRLPSVVALTVTNETRRIDGVVALATADEDTVNGQLVGEARDYYAQDRHGNVWYLGELTTHYVNGMFTDHADTWFGGRKGARPGIIMLAHPRLGLPKYQQEFAPAIATDEGHVIKLHQDICVAAGCFHEVMEVEETTPLDPGVIEDKYYAPGIGYPVKSVTVQGDPEESDLVSVTPSR